MNRTPDVELVLREWLADDGDIAPDRVLEVVADRIARQPRRRASRLLWRPFMNTQLRLVAGLAAAVIVAVVAWQLLRPAAGVGSPTSTPLAPPSASATSDAPVRLTEGPLGPGRY